MKQDFIRAGKPVENGYIESLNRPTAESGRHPRIPRNPKAVSCRNAFNLAAYS
jgi:hypothetical protein